MINPMMRSIVRVELLLIVSFTLLSGSTSMYICNSVIIEAKDIFSYDMINDMTVQSIDNGTNNNTALGFTGSNTDIINMIYDYFWLYSVGRTRRQH